MYEPHDVDRLRDAILESHARPVIIDALADIRLFLSSSPKVKSKTVRNYHAGLSAMWQWAKLEGIVPVNIIRDVKAPKADSRVIVPFTAAEIRTMLGVSVKATGGLQWQGGEVQARQRCTKQGHCLVDARHRSAHL